MNRERTLEDYGIKSFRGELFCSRQCHRENLEGKMPKHLSPELRTLLEENLETHKQQVFSLLIWESANLRNKLEDDELIEKAVKRTEQRIMKESQEDEDLSLIHI